MICRRGGQRKPVSANQGGTPTDGCRVIHKACSCRWPAAGPAIDPTPRVSALPPSQE